MRSTFVSAASVHRGGHPSARATLRVTVRLMDSPLSDSLAGATEVASTPATAAPAGIV